ncbi:MAG: MBL fold metallo-hydrolase [Candidatus Limnocylindria bacterium]
MSARVGAVEAVVMDVHLPAGVAGPDPLSFDVRCFLVAHPTGVVLIDTCLPGSDDLIGGALERTGAAWSDITDIVLTHAHADHIGGLPAVTSRAAGASVWAGAEDQALIPFGGQWRTLAEGGRVRELHVLETPGHTPGHCSLVHEDASLLFAGDLVGTMVGTLMRSPAAFTQDAGLAERSLQRVAELHYDRVLFSHGGEISEPMDALRQLVRTDAAVASTRNSRTSPRTR